MEKYPFQYIFLYFFARIIKSKLTNFNDFFKPIGPISSVKLNPSLYPLKHVARPWSSSAFTQK